MTIAIMQPYFVPYIGYFQLINLVDKFIIYDDVNYIKKGWVNRNRILVNAEPSFINVPLSGASQNKLIKDVDVISEANFLQKQKKSIFFAYKAAPFFESTYELLEEALVFQPDISRFNTHILKVICKWLGITTEIIESSVIYENQDLKGQERILDICVKEKATDYINPIGGMELYDKSGFEKENIKLGFIEADKIVYNQFQNEFVPFLSIIDLLMFNSPQDVKHHLKGYKLR